jgi:hypothetical protein
MSEPQLRGRILNDCAPPGNGVDASAAVTSVLLADG